MVKGYYIQKAKIKPNSVVVYNYWQGSKSLNMQNANLMDNFKGSANKNADEEKFVGSKTTYLPNREVRRYCGQMTKGQRGIYTSIKVGRYLTKFFGDILTEKEIADYTEWQISGVRDSEYSNNSEYPLLFARTPDEIEDVYINGPSSCMSYEQDRYKSCTRHPVVVYGAGDLAIAYIKSKKKKSKVLARALVWPDHKIYGRIYPNTGSWREDGFSSQEDSENASKALESKLRALKYKNISVNKKGFDGARLLKIPATLRNHYHMPYLDRDYKINNDTNFFRMALEGQYNGGNTNGVTEIHRIYKYKCQRCSHKSDELEDFQEAVIDRPRENVFTYGKFCQNCYRTTYFCHGYKKHISPSITSIVVEGVGAVSYWWAKYYAFESAIDSAYYPLTEQVIMQSGEAWHRSYFNKHGFTCRITKQNWPNRFAHEKYPDVYMGIPDYKIESTFIPDDRQLTLV